MPIMLRAAAALYGDVRLANNDVRLEMVTPRANVEVKTFPGEKSKEYRDWNREFDNRTAFDWNAFIFWLPPEKRNDKAYIELMRDSFHIHMFAQLTLGEKYGRGGGLLIEKLLPKSGDRVGRQINLADEPLDQWDELVADMAGYTRETVKRFREHYVEWHFVVQPPTNA